jgi:hypothetical protein
MLKDEALTKALNLLLHSDLGPLRQPLNSYNHEVARRNLMVIAV